MSSVVHGHWNSIARQNLQLCTNPLHDTHRLPYEYPRQIRLEVVAAALNLYAESYSVVSTLAGTGSSNSPVVEAWYKDANKATGWGIYTSSEDNDTEKPAEEESDRKSSGGPPPAAEDEPAK